MKNLEQKPLVNLLTSPAWEDYQLLDSGNGRKLEQFGPYRLIRPEAEAVWSPLMDESEWKEAAAEFIPSAEENGGHWKTLKKLPDSWKLRYRNLTLKAMLSNSKQLGVFPEQACQWDWLTERVRNYGKPMKVLNLFGYTGAATMACAAAGAKVTHLDASKKAVAWAKENQELSKVPLDRIRWILDDALKFVQREARRGSLYEGVILDPDALVSMNLWGFTPDFFDAGIAYLDAFLKDGSGDPLKKECLLPALVDTLMHTSGLKVEVLSTKAVWFGVTYKEDKDYVAGELKKLHDNGSYPPAL